MEPSGLRLDTFTSSAMELAKGILSRLGLTTGAPLLPFVPKPVKLTLILLLVLNAPSFPLVWHLRVLLFPYRSFLLVRLQGKRKWLDDWSKRNDDKGRIARIKTVSKRRAWLDDCDFNGHLSNSCYAKSADPARIEFCGQALNPLFHAGAHCALGGSYYTFIKEIPVGSEYVMECRAGGWGDKWFYVITEFIIYPKKGSSKTKNTKDTKDKGRTNGANVANGANGVNGANIPANYSSVAVAVEQAKASLAAALPSPPPPLGMTLSADPSPSVSGTTTPATSDHGNSNGTRTGATTPGTDLLEPLDSLDSLEAAKTVASVRVRQPREDGGVVCCFSVVEYCFKVGRVTVPPRIAMYLALQSPSVSAREHARSLILSPDGGKAWLRSGWKSEPEADKLGRDIGVAERTGTAQGKGLEGLEGVEGGVEWVEKGRRGMEVVGEGLGML